MSNPIPKNMLVECNRRNALIKDDSHPNEWTCSFNNLELKEGSQINIHSAYLNSIGVFDGISYNHSGDNQDDTATILMSYYISNDGYNQKREGYNIDNVGKVYKDYDNRPMTLYRFQSLTTNEANNQSGNGLNLWGLGNYHRYVEDPYIPTLFYNNVRLPPNKFSIAGIKFRYFDTSIFPSQNGCLYSDTEDLTRKIHLGRSYFIRFNNLQFGGNPDNSRHFDGIFNAIEYQFLGSGAGDKNKIGLVGVNLTNWFGTPPNDGDEWTADIDVVGVPTYFYADTASYGFINYFNPDDSNCKYAIGDTIYNTRLYARTMAEENDYTELGEMVVTGLWDNQDSGYYVETNLTAALGANDTNLQVPPAIHTNYAGALLFIAIEQNSTYEYMLGWITNANTNINLKRSQTGDDIIFGGEPNRAYVGTEKVRIWRLYDTVYNMFYDADILSGVVYDSITQAGYIDAGAPYRRPESVVTTMNQNYPVNTLPDEFNNNIYQIGQVGDNQNFVKHYRYKTFSIPNINYASPSDLATELTKQAHQLTNARDANGDEVENTAGVGIPQNEFVFPVWTPSSSDGVPGGATKYEEDANASTNFWHLHDGTKVYGTLTNMEQLVEGSFCCIHYVKDIPNVANNYYFIWFRTSNLYHNLGDMTNGANGSGEKSVVYKDGYDVKANNDQNIGQTLQKLEQQNYINGFPIRYIDGVDCFVSQLIGTNNLTFDFDEDLSKFVIDFAHQAVISTYKVESGTASGGDPSIILYFPAPVGTNNTPYKLNKTRLGGINIENWSMYLYNKNLYTPTDVRNGTIQSVFTKNIEPIGLRFWSKLGFTQSFLDSYSGVTYNDDNQLIPLGTTDALIDSANALITLAEPPENEPRYFDINTFDDSTKDTNGIQALYKYSSYAGMYLTNCARGYGLPNTTGRPEQYIESKFSGNISFNNTEYYKTGDLNRLASTFNPDRERHRGITVQAVSDKITATSEPVKVEEPYFYILSDIVDETEGYITYNNLRLPIVGIVSKLNAAQDFYFGYSSPLTFYVRKTRNVSTIKVKILTATLKEPSLINNNSSIIFQIINNNDTPSIDYGSLFQQQQYLIGQLMDALQASVEKKINKRSLENEYFQSYLLPINEQQQINTNLGLNQQDFRLAIEDMVALAPNPQEINQMVVVPQPLQPNPNLVGMGIVGGMVVQNPLNVPQAPVVPPDPIQQHIFNLFNIPTMGEFMNNITLSRKLLIFRERIRQQSNNSRADSSLALLVGHALARLEGQGGIVGISTRASQNRRFTDLELIRQMGENRLDSVPFFQNIDPTTDVRETIFLRRYTEWANTSEVIQQHILGEFYQDFITNPTYGGGIPEFFESHEDPEYKLLMNRNYLLNWSRDGARNPPELPYPEIQTDLHHRTRPGGDMETNYNRYRGHIERRRQEANGEIPEDEGANAMEQVD